MGSLECVAELLENTKEGFLKVANALLRILGNVEQNKDEQRYRKVNLAGEFFSENILPFNGGINCLFYAGFMEDGEYLLLPMDSDLSKLTAAKEQIAAEIHRVETDNCMKKKPVPASNTHNSSGQKPKSIWKRWVFPSYPADIQELERTLHNRLRASFEHVLCYEKPALQNKARGCIPTGQLMEAAIRKLKLSKDSTTFDIMDFFLIELMDWFRDDFFQWVNAPECEICDAATQQIGMGQPSLEDMASGAGRVELYKCKECAHVTRFPRYNDPGKLLETRRGRCGEWANTFTLICRASGYEARHVVDWTDHVWTEVFSRSQDRWLHCDPGEKALDKPLLYEAGWGKQLTYVVAFSKDDLCDVTWRYSAHHDQLVLRRTSCREHHLLNMIQRLRDERQRGMDAATKQKHQLRLIKEGCEFLSPQDRQVSAGETMGRQTGSLAWRQQRGELGVQAAYESHMFSPTPTQVEQKKMVIKYYCATNKYTHGDESIHDWMTGIYQCQDVIRNVEVDWNMVYLARSRGSDSASVSWRFDVTSAATFINKVNVTVSSETFHNGRVKWTLEAGDHTHHVLQPNQTCELTDLGNCGYVMLTAELSAGSGENAWQHTQLFRQKRSSTESSMSVELFMN